MIYIDKRALQNGKSALSLTPYVNLNQLIQQIVDPHYFPTPHDDISFSTRKEISLNISELNGQYFMALDLGVFSKTASLESVQKTIPPCTFGTMTFNVLRNTADEDIVFWLLSNEDIIGSITVAAGDDGNFSVSGEVGDLGALAICINITGGTGSIVFSEITTTFTT